jgi:hypothetical protein
MMHQRLLAGLVAATMAVAACARDSASPTLEQKGPSGASAPVKPGDTTGAQSPSTPAPIEPTSNNPVASVTLSASSLSVGVGYYGHIEAIGRDADGVRVANARATWTSADANIVIASDTGVMYGKAIGSTTVTATIAGHTASATVNVVAAPAPPTVPPAQPAVASFDLTATVVGALAGQDTSRTESVSGAKVHLMRTGGVTGDTLATAIDAGTATTDANGVVSFKKLTGGWYTVDITPPAGSPYAAIRTGFSAPRVTDVRATFVLRRN